MLTDEQANDVVQGAIFEAGGFKGPHPDDRTLSQAGLINEQQRRGFQPAVAQKVEDYHHKIEDLSRIPNSAGTKVAEVRKHVVEKAEAIPIKE